MTDFTKKITRQPAEAVDRDGGGRFLSQTHWLEAQVEALVQTAHRRQVAAPNYVKYERIRATAEGAYVAADTTTATRRRAEEWGF